jgi:hypothetical protein
MRFRLRLFRFTRLRAGLMPLLFISVFAMVTAFTSGVASASICGGDIACLSRCTSREATRVKAAVSWARVPQRESRSRRT